MIWKICKKYIRIVLVISLLCLVLLYCDSDGGTTVTLDLDNKDKVADVLIRLIEISEKDELSKEDKKRKIESILAEYGIDTKSETIKFAKKAQKYSYNKLFKDKLLKLHEK